MKKGKLGLDLRFYAVFALVAALLAQPLLCALIAGVAIIFEKDEFTGVSTLQALFLSVFASMGGSVLLSINGFINNLPRFSLFSDWSFGNVFYLLYYLILLAVTVLVYIFGLMGLAKAIKGQDPSVPVFKNWAYKAYGKLVPQPTSPYTQPGQPGAPYGTQPGQPPVGQPPAGAPQQPYGTQPGQNQPPQNP